MAVQPGKTVQEIAQFLERAAHETPEAFDAAVDAIWADEGALVGHTPPLPSDGIMQREFVTEAHRRVAEVMRRAMPDFRYENISAKVAGEVVDFAYDQTGTTAAGQRLSARIGVRFTIRDGQVKEAVSAFDHERMAPFMALMADLTPAG